VIITSGVNNTTAGMRQHSMQNIAELAPQVQQVAELLPDLPTIKRDTTQVTSKGA
jgi:hypothetical protein